MHKDIPNENIKLSLQKVASLLRDGNISYWLGRGVLKDLLINREIKLSHGDLDLHILAEDKDALRKYLIPILEKEGYSVENAEHKLALRKPYRDPEFYVEFPYIFQDEENPDFVYHIANGRRERCKKDCFVDTKEESIEIGGKKIRIPNHPELYLEGVYGENWKNEHLVEKVNFFRKFGFR